MLRVVGAQVWRRRGRSMAVVAAIVVAAVSFSLLTSAVSTSQLRVEGTVEENFRSAYDVLVRPPGSRSELERADRLVRPNFLSDIFGGITLGQYRRIAAMPGVEVAAPVAMVGYVLPNVYLPITVDDVETNAVHQLFRIEKTWLAQRGLSAYPDGTAYIYVTTRPGDPVGVCAKYHAMNDRAPRSAFDLTAYIGAACYSTKTVRPGPTGLPGVKRGEEGIFYQLPYPLLLAAIDPVQEARLVDVDEAVTDGRYLQAEDRPRTRPATPSDPTSLNYRQVPVVMANRTVVQERLRIEVQRLDLPRPGRVPDRLASAGAKKWLAGLTGPTVRSTTQSAAELYPRIVRQFRQQDVYQEGVQYWDAGPVTYQPSGEGHLAPVPQRNPRSTWAEARVGYLAPPDNADVGFRKLTVHVGSNNITGNVYDSPVLRAVGVFDPDRIRGFSRLSQVLLTTYYPPAVAPGDERSAELLGGRALLPDNNLAGYVQQPPLLLTNLRSLSAFRDPNAYSNVDFEEGPISVVRVRVAGVSGPDPLSQERVRVVAERIARVTGLEVDVTIGSSPQPQLIDLPAGEYGRPALTLEEGWSRKGVTVALLSAIDRKSLALFGLVLLVCVLFLLNATTAAVRARRAELGVLACLGWPRRRIFALLEAELLATGLLAGLVGTGIAATAVTALDLRTNWQQLALITPVATLLAALAGIPPAWRAGQATPMEAIRPATRAPRRRATKVGSVSGLALVGITRWPGRTALGAAALFIGVAALAVLIAVQTGFHGQVTGTLLGDAIAVEVRGVDYAAAALTVALGAFAVADIAYLNISERVEEIGTMRASGWAESHLRRLFATEALATAALGATLGAATGLTLVAILLPIALQPVLLAAAIATTGGLAAALLALLIPLTQLNKIAPAAAIATE